MEKLDNTSHMGRMMMDSNCMPHTLGIAIHGLPKLGLGDNAFGYFDLTFKNVDMAQASKLLKGNIVAHIVSTAIENWEIAFDKKFPSDIKALIGMAVYDGIDSLPSSDAERLVSFVESLYMK